MKSLVKAISKPFKTSKAQKPTSSKGEDLQKDQKNYQLEKNIDFRDGVAKVQARFHFLYNQVQKMVDQLGVALHFKEKMTEQQKRELIYEISSIAMNENKMGTQLMDEDVLSADDDEQDDEKPKQVQPLEIAKNYAYKEKQCEATRSSEYTPPKPVESPQKQLKDLFQEFERNQKESSSIEKKKYIKQELSTYGQIKSKMSSFFSKNSSKVLKLLKLKNNQNQKVIKQVETDDKIPQQKQLQISKKQKKKSFMSSILPSWNSKKEIKYPSISSSTIVQPKIFAQL